MNPHELESQLSQFETQLASLSVALMHNDASKLAAAATGLQSLTVGFSKVLQDTAVHLKGDRSGQLRVKKMTNLLNATGEGLARHRAGVDRALATLMPATQSNTYTVKVGTFARPPYACAGRQSGEFRAISP